MWLSSLRSTEVAVDFVAAHRLAVPLLEEICLCSQTGECCKLKGPKLLIYC